MNISAGILLYRVHREAEFLLVHPGGPFFALKDAGWWTIPKGEPLPNEDLLTTAIREFKEETGFTPNQSFIQLQPIVQKGGKKVFCWGCEGDIDADNITCNLFEIEWPPKSGKKTQYPEVDKAKWFTAEEACLAINERQRPFITELLGKLNSSN